MASSNPPLYVFIIIIVVRFIITILTVHGGIPHMATNHDEYNGYYIPIFLKGQSYSVVHGQYEQLLGLIYVDFFA